MEIPKRAGAGEGGKPTPRKRPVCGKGLPYEHAAG